jgi:two-component system, cell cycle sensor histidine kinase and response regulator CckA
MDRTDFEPWKGREVARLLALVENQRRYYQDMVSSLPVGLVVLAANRSVVLANRAFREAFGMSVEDLRGKTIEQILPSDRLIEKIRDVTLHGTPSPGGMPSPGFLLERGGKVLRVAILPIRPWDEETEMETLLMVADVTDVRPASGPAAGAILPVPVAHPLSAPLPAFPVETLPATVWRADAAALQFIAVGGAVEQMVGYPASHWLKSPGFFAQRIHREDRDTVLALYRKAVKESREASAEFRIVTASGEPMWCRETVRLAEPGVLSGVLTAIGQRREIEQLRIAAERNSALQTLSGRLAHDLNNPLMIISGYAEEMLRPLAANDARRGDLEEILAATERIGNLTAQLLQFTRKPESPVERVDLAALLSSLAEGRLEIRAPQPVWARANRRHLEGILQALVLSMREEVRTRITITCQEATIMESLTGSRLTPGTYAQLALHATGRGLDPEKRQTIFESFLHKESGRPANSALAQAYATVREWGGELGFESEPSQGSTFTMYLPLADAEPLPGTPTISPPISAAAPATILVVDDEAGIRALIVKILRRERYLVLEAGSAAEAAAAAAAHHGPIHLLLTDMMLPDRNGRQLAEQLREKLPELKVMYISGFTDDESVRTGAFPPGARFLQKPFTLGALMQTVRESLDR